MVSDERETSLPGWKTVFMIPTSLTLTAAGLTNTHVRFGSRADDPSRTGKSLLVSLQGMVLSVCLNAHYIYVILFT